MTVAKRLMMCMPALLLAFVSVSGCMQVEKIENNHTEPKIDYIDFEIEIDGKIVQKHRQKYHYQENSEGEDEE